MNSNHVVMIAAAGYIAFLAFAAGSMSAIGLSDEAPYGAAEFFLFRYQTLITGFVAVLGIWGVFRQIRLGELQHRNMMAFNLERERRALQYINLYAASIRVNVVSALEPPEAIVVLDRQLPEFEQSRRNLIASEVSPMILHALDTVRGEVEEFNRLLSPGVKNASDPWIARSKVQFKKVIDAVDRQNRLTTARWAEMTQLFDVDPDTSRHH